MLDRDMRVRETLVAGVFVGVQGCIVRCFLLDEPLQIQLGEVRHGSRADFPGRTVENACERRIAEYAATTARHLSVAIARLAVALRLLYLDRTAEAPAVFVRRSMFAD